MSFADIDKPVPRHIVEQYADDPGVASLLRKNLPLTRNTYLGHAWGILPEPWTADHEADVPECFRDPGAVQPHPDKKRGLTD